MSFQRKSYRLTWPEGSRWSGLEVVMKGLSGGNLLKVSSLKGASKDEIGEELITDILAIVGERMIRWNLTDEQENPVPTDAATLAGEDFGMMMDIVNAWTHAVVGVTASLGKESNSGNTFPEGSIPMETS